MVSLYVFMSACLHYKINADIQKQRVQTNADIQEWLKIRLLQEMSACLHNILYI